MALEAVQIQIDKCFVAIQLHYFLKGTNNPTFNVGTLLIVHRSFDIWHFVYQFVEG